MRIGATSSAFAGFTTQQLQQNQNSALTLSTAARRQQLVQTRSTLLDLRRSLNEALRFLDPARLRTGLRVDSADVAVPGSTLGLDLVGVASTLTSTAEVNTRTTSFETRGPTLEQGNTNIVTIGGRYQPNLNGSGIVGDQTLRFDITKTGQNVKLDVISNAGTQSFTIPNSDPPGKIYTLDSGLTISFSSPVFATNDGFDLDIFETVGTDVQPDNPFNGSRLTHPELDDGYNAGEANAIVDGSFQLNGTSIQVFATDSLNTLLSRINAAGAGATASYDAATDKVVFTADDAGSNPISLTNDTSGILAALKLSSATTVPGEDSDLDKPLSQVAAFAGVTAGTVLVNGQAVAVDPTVDTLNSLLPLLDAADPNVSFALVGDRVEVTVTGSADLSDDNGLLAAFGLQSGTISAGSETGVRFSTSRARLAADALKDVFDALHDLLSDPLAGGVATSQVRFLRNDIRNALGEALDAVGQRERTDFGLSVDLREGATREVTFGLTGARRLVDALRRGDEEPIDVLLGEDPDDLGLLEVLDELVTTQLKALSGTTLGLTTDVMA